MLGRLREKAASGFGMTGASSSSTSDLGSRELHMIYEWGIGVEPEPNLPSLHNLTRLFKKRVKLIAADTHKIVIAEANGGAQEVYVWGDNTWGQCGLGEDVTDMVIVKPTKVPMMASTKSVVVRFGLSTLVDENGTLHMAGAYKQGDPPVRKFKPVHVAYGAEVLQVELGRSHQAVLVRDGENKTKLMTWGANPFGQLGHSELGAVVDTPKAVDCDWNGGFVEVIGTGTSHMIAHTNKGDLWAWGKNIHISPTDLDPENKPPILGIKGKKADKILRPKKLTLKSKLGVVKICGSDSHSVVLDRNGRVFVWGECGYGGLGLGPDTTYTPVPIENKSLQEVADIACGGRHTMTLHKDGTVRMCGYGRRGALGLGDQKDVSVPTQLHLYGSPVRARLIAAGQFASAAFMRFVPHPDRNWFSTNRAAGPLLEELSTDGAIPYVIERSLSFIESNPAHLNAEGIYRVAPDERGKRILGLLWETGEDFDDFPEEYKTVYNVTGCLKIFLRTLKEPVLRYEVFKDFFDAVTNEDGAPQQIRQLGRLLRSLPSVYWKTAQRLLMHGQMVQAYEANKMGLEAVARMFGNMVLQNPDTSPEGLLLQGEVGEVVRPMIEHGSIVLNDFYYNLYASLLLGQKDPAMVHELVSELAKTPVAPRLQEEWLDLLLQKIAPNPINEAALQQHYDNLNQRLKQIEADTKPPPHLSLEGFLRQRNERLIELVKECDQAAVDQPFANPITDTLFKIARFQQATSRVPPIHSPDRNLKVSTIPPPPHPILMVNIDYTGTDEEATCMRKLQQLAQSDQSLQEQIRSLESKLASLWETIGSEQTRFMKMRNKRLLRVLQLIVQCTRDFCSQTEVARLKQFVKLAEGSILSGVAVLRSNLSLLSIHTPSNKATLRTLYTFANRQHPKTQPQLVAALDQLSDEIKGERNRARSAARESSAAALEGLPGGLRLPHHLPPPLPSSLPPPCTPIAAASSSSSSYSSPSSSSPSTTADNASSSSSSSSGTNGAAKLPVPQNPTPADKHSSAEVPPRRATVAEADTNQRKFSLPPPLTTEPAGSFPQVAPPGRPQRPARGPGGMRGRGRGGMRGRGRGAPRPHAAVNPLSSSLGAAPSSAPSRPPRQ